MSELELWVEFWVQFWVQLLSLSSQFRCELSCWAEVLSWVCVFGLWLEFVSLSCELRPELHCWVQLFNSEIKEQRVIKHPAKRSTCFFFDWIENHLVKTHQEPFLSLFASTYQLITQAQTWSPFLNQHFWETEGGVTRWEWIHYFRGSRLEKDTF